jgi:hypothetical protein
VAQASGLAADTSADGSGIDAVRISWPSADIRWAAGRRAAGTDLPDHQPAGNGEGRLFFHRVRTREAA